MKFIIRVFLIICCLFSFSISFNEHIKSMITRDFQISYRKDSIQDNSESFSIENNNLKKEIKSNTKNLIFQAKEGSENNRILDNLKSNDISWAKCFIRFDSNFYDLNIFPVFKFTPIETLKEVTVNLCSDISNNCQNTGIVVDSDCKVIAGDQKQEKSWLKDGKKLSFK